MDGKSCWSCGHYLIGGGCWKDGQLGQDGWKDVSPNDCCDSWVPENTEGTINGIIDAELEALESD